jgi:hypothetical protein
VCKGCGERTLEKVPGQVRWRKNAPRVVNPQGPNAELHAAGLRATRRPLHAIVRCTNEHCPECGIIKHRDHGNAAANILQIGANLLCYRGVRPPQFERRPAAPAAEEEEEDFDDDDDFDFDAADV